MLVPYVVSFYRCNNCIVNRVYWFNVPVRQHVILNAAVAGIPTGSLGLGILISTVARTQLQAMQMTVSLLPSVLLSGFFSPGSNALPIQLLGNLIPLLFGNPRGNP